MTTACAPERLQWAVRALDIAADDQVLEVGCGRGVAAALVCDRLIGGRITAIDRSAIAIRRATQRNSDNIAAGKAIFRHTDLAGFTPAGTRFDKVFAVNVNLFWVRAADPELVILRRLLGDDGVLSLFYGTPDHHKAGHDTADLRAWCAGWDPEFFDLEAVRRRFDY